MLYRENNKVKIKVSNELADIFIFYIGKLYFLISELIWINSMGNILSL